ATWRCLRPIRTSIPHSCFLSRHNSRRRPPLCRSMQLLEEGGSDPDCAVFCKSTKSMPGGKVSSTFRLAIYEERQEGSSRAENRNVLYCTVLKRLALVGTRARSSVRICAAAATNVVLSSPDL